MERAQCICCGYLRKIDDAAIRFRTLIPNNEMHYQMHYQMPDHSWLYTVYGQGCEEKDAMDDMPKGNWVRTTSFVDANLQHCKVTGKSATGILLHVVNQTPVDWFSKRQGTVETSTYASEFVAARIATEHIIDLRITLQSMGVPLDGPSWMLGDNESVVNSSTIPQSVMAKRHTALSYHRVRAAISTGIMFFCHVSGKENPADIMTKFVPYSVFWPLIRPILFWRGETMQ